MEFMMATLVFICDDGMDSVAAMGDEVGIHLYGEDDI